MNKFARATGLIFLTFALIVGMGGVSSAAAASQVKAWGSNSYGNLGDGTSVDRPTPVSSLAGSGVTQVAAGSATSFFLYSNGTVKVSGSGPNGLLGNGSISGSTSTPTAVSISSVTQIVTGSDSAAALKQNGTVWTWGNGSYGQLGDGRYGSGVPSDPPITTTTPTQVAGLTNVIALAAGARHYLALKSDGSVWTWGSNNYGELGHSQTANTSACKCTPTPASITVPSGVVQVTAGDSSSAIRLTSGAVYTWGQFYNGQLGYTPPTSSQPFNMTPRQVPGIPSVKYISAGNLHMLAVATDGTVRAWGSNTNGQLGNGTTTGGPTPVTVSGLTGVTQVSAGNQISAALTSSGTVRTWGWNAYGQLGNGTTTDATTPTTALTGASSTWISQGYRAFSLFAGLT